MEVKGRDLPTTLREVMGWKSNRTERERAIRINYLRGAEAYLIVGCLLRQSKNAGDWKKDGIANNFGEWIERELFISRSNGLRMLVIWDVISPLLEKHADLILQIDFSKLAEVAPIIKGMNEPLQLEWLHKAAANTMVDLKNNCREHKGKTPTDTCDHNNTEPWAKCKTCGAFIKM